MRSAIGLKDRPGLVRAWRMLRSNMCQDGAGNILVPPTLQYSAHLLDKLRIWVDGQDLMRIQRHKVDLAVWCLDAAGLVRVRR